MDILNQIVEKLTKDELRFFKFHLGAFPGAERKDLVLVDYVRQSGNKFDEEKVILAYGFNIFLVFVKVKKPFSFI